MAEFSKHVAAAWSRRKLLALAAISLVPLLGRPGAARAAAVPEPAPKGTRRAGGWILRADDRGPDTDPRGGQV